MRCHCTGEQRTDPDGKEGDGDEDRGGDGAHGVGPAAGAVHEAVEEAQLPLEQRRARGVQDDLEVALQSRACPLRAVSPQGFMRTAASITCLVIGRALADGRYMQRCIGGQSSGSFRWWAHWLRRPCSHENTNPPIA